MPELPEVETIKRSLENQIVGRTIIKEFVGNFSIIKPPDTALNFQKNVIGLTFERIHRRGKYLIFEMSNKYNLVIHLGMTGALFCIYTYKDIPKKYANHVEVMLTLDNGEFLVYCDIRKFGGIRLLNQQQMNNFKPLIKMGSEPVEGLQGFSEFFQNLAKNKNRNKTIKELLLDQTVIAGVGNIYACEALYASKIKPDRLVKDIDLLEARILYGYLCIILEESIEEGGSSVSDYVDANGKKGNYQKYHKVYNKKQCPLGHNINNVKIHNRSSFYCSICQK